MKTYEKRFYHTSAIRTLIFLYLSSTLASFGTSSSPSSHTTGLFLSIVRGVFIECTLNSPTWHVQFRESRKIRVKMLLPIAS